MRSFPLVIALSAGIAAAQQPGRFGSWLNCGICHGRTAAPPGSPAGLPASIAPAQLWRGSMMAHSARDPYWRAKVQFESAATPSAVEVIQDTCLRCHAPMQQYDLRTAGLRMRLDDVTGIGEEGTSCTVCHQITSDGLGTKQSFDAEFHINDQRKIFGPHGNPSGQPMINRSGYTPVESRHILESSLCGSCHTVITPVLDAEGNSHGEFLEQAPFLEWMVSEFPERGRTCQSCHMPVLTNAAGQELRQYIAHQPNGVGVFPLLSPRSPYGLHTLAGGNVPMLRLLKAVFPAEIPQLDDTIRFTEQSLSGALGLAINGNRTDSELRLDVTVSNNTGHKLPTAYPSRHIWLHVLVKDALGQTVFESGAPGADFGLQPHHRVIERPDQVMVYEAELQDPNGSPTVSLLRSSSYGKDNRILPRGFDLSTPLPTGIDPAGITPVGVDGDDDFQPGKDQVAYRIPLGTRAPLIVRVEAWYQSIKPTHLLVMGPDLKPEPELVSRREILVE